MTSPSVGRPPAIRIEDPADPRIEPYRAVRERDLAGRDGLFVIEGRVVLEKAVAAIPQQIVSVLVAEGRLPALAPMLAALEPTTPLYVAGQAVMDAIVGFPIHRGILALGRRAPIAPDALLAALPAEALVVGLMGIANHDNMGGVFRNCAAFGADAVLLDPTCCDPLYRKAIRVSVGAALITPFARLAPGQDMVGMLEGAGFQVLALSPGGAVDIAALTPSARTAVLLGAEGPGLPKMVLQQATTVRISMSNAFDSLNVSTTSGIVLHQIAAARRTLQTSSA
jgi:tRNA G18 (ribose-2'-O)-methylase SpoU